MTCKDCIHSGLCYKENDYENFPNRCGNFIPERPQGDLISRSKFSNAFNNAVYAKLHNEYLKSTANQELKDVAEFVTTDIMIIFNNLIEKEGAEND